MTRQSIHFTEVLFRWMPTELGLARVLDIIKRRKSGKPDLRGQARA
jgi:hypothetical protein